jgi:uncharacterized membrane protein
MENDKKQKYYLILKIVLILGAVTLLGLWLWFSPPGVFGKADAIGYAVCHQIAERSFTIGERKFPLCARCTGMYLGAFITFVYQLKRKRAGALPPRKLWFFFGLLFVLFAIDGSNSYLHFFENAPSLYEPNNTFRLITGLGLGMCMAAVLYPIFHQTMWDDWIDNPTMHSYVDILKLILYTIVIFFIISSENSIFMFLFALLSTGTILFMLGLIYTVLITMLLKKENSFHQVSEIKWLALTGFCCAIAQIATMDLLRYRLTGTWAGFSF